jgi:hypothetical protein
MGSGGVNLDNFDAIPQGVYNSLYLLTGYRKVTINISIFLEDIL